MASVFFDSSALVKLVIDEEGTAVATRMWDECDVALASRLAYPEVRAAVAASGRNHDLTPAQVRTASSLWREVWSTIRVVELTPSVGEHAGDLAPRHSLRGADAVHLASALALSSPDLLVAAWDRRLATAAAAVGLAVVPSP